MKRKFRVKPFRGAGMMMTIILVSVLGWVAIVAFVIKPDIRAGAFLCLAGGIAIGLIVVYLIRKWWFKGKPDLADRMMKALKDE